MKPMPSLIILADRGNLIAYKTVSPGRLEKTESLDLVEGREKISEQYADKAGNFAMGSQVQGGGTAERFLMEEELEKRILTTIARLITEICGKEGAQSWGFAAASEINEAILEHVSPTLRARLTVNVRKDLTNTPAKEVAEHFSSAETEG
ncbi:MAG: hypothetical protein JWO89_3714 [Verrucomicrobiaceae bacterium]|nr:hypothetical protein [Verrucomicrobiaceae bacterium]